MMHYSMGSEATRQIPVDVMLLWITLRLTDHNQLTQCLATKRNKKYGTR